jgi:hypothetical protein
VWIALGRVRAQPPQVGPAYPVMRERLAGIEPEQLQCDPTFHPIEESRRVPRR